LDIALRERTGEDESLCLVAAECSQASELFRCLDSYGDRAQAQVAGEVDDGGDDPLVLGVGSPYETTDRSSRR
jgi:hypothetical protein